MSKQELLNQLEEYGIEDISLCNCGAYTVTINNKNYSVHKDNFFKFFPDIDEEIFNESIKKILMNNFYNCNHCVNNWGLDLCACGSGESPKECEEGLEECGQPMQNIEAGYNHVRGGSSWM